MNIFKKMYFKVFNREKYKQLKRAARAEKFFKSVETVNSIDVRIPKLESCSFLHSGNCGDIIYALPAMAALAQACGCGHYSLDLKVNVSCQYSAGIVHPYGNVMLNDVAFDMILPLLEYQKNIDVCDRYRGQNIDFNMDTFRDRLILFDRSDIAHWYALVFPIGIDTSKPWLSVPASPITKDAIVIARSTRYRMPTIDYKFLRRYRNLFFVGLESEFVEMRAAIPRLTFLESKDFLEMASYIAGAKLFIGNQSFPFSLAEALKVPRLLETFYSAPNVVVSGLGGHMFCFQNCFEILAERLISAED